VETTSLIILQMRYVSHPETLFTYHDHFWRLQEKVSYIIIIWWRWVQRCGVLLFVKIVNPLVFLLYFIIASFK